MRFLNIALVILMLGFIGLSLSYITYAEEESHSIYDSRSSWNRSGEDDHRKYFLPVLPPYGKTDFTEFNDYRNLPYAPYAALQLTRSVHYNQVSLAPGYYLVKLDIGPMPDAAGNIVTGDSESQKSTTQEDLSDRPLGFRQRRRMRKRVYPMLPQNQTQTGQVPSINLIIKRGGGIEATIPVQASEPLNPPLKKEASVNLVSESGDVLTPEILYLKYCVQQVCYRSAPLMAGLVQ